MDTRESMSETCWGCGEDLKVNPKKGPGDSDMICPDPKCDSHLGDW